MLPALLAHFVPFPVDALPMPELCRRLTLATGVAHGVDGTLRDYPVFVSVRKDDPKRVRALVAAALGGEWQQDGKVLRLTPVKPKAGEGLPEFERLFRLAAAGRSYLAALPLEELYRLAPGSQVRYGLPSGPLFRPFPKAYAAALTAKPEPEGRIVVRRDAYGSFSIRQDSSDLHTGVFTSGGQITIDGIAPPVAALLSARLGEKALTEEEAAAVGRLLNDPTNLKIDWRALDREDPLAAFTDPFLKKAAAKVDSDLVVALPDLVAMAAPAAGSGGGTVGKILGAFSMAVEWRVVDGAVVGRLSEAERTTPSQTRRTVLSNFVIKARARGVPSPGDLTAYLSAQRSAASDTWADLMLLVMAGVVVDEAYLRDHPYNLRFGDRFSTQDWAVVRTRWPFLASSLSSGARTALNALLLAPRSRLESGEPDPATWPSLASDNLRNVADLVEEDVVIGWTGFSAGVESPRNALSGYERHRTQLGREPLYQPARRRKLKLTISPSGREESVETGFGEVTPTAGTKPTPWAGLPESVRKAAGPADVGAPPPPPP